FIFYVESKKRRNSRHQFMTQLLNHLQRFWRTSRGVYYIVCRKTPVGGGYFISMLILLNVLHNGFRKNLKTFFIHGLQKCIYNGLRRITFGKNTVVSFNLQRNTPLFKPIHGITRLKFMKDTDEFLIPAW